MKAVIIVVVLFFGTISFAQNSCRKLFIENAIAFDRALLDVQGEIVIGDFKFHGFLQEIVKQTEIKKLIEENAGKAHQVLAKVKLASEIGGGELRLVTLDISDGNRAYNHQEVVALLRINPQLANRLGFFAVEGHENIIWAPDIEQMNHRLRAVAQEHGFESALWSYGKAVGVISFGPYIELLSSGRFPYSTDSDVNLSIHDAMHAVSFAALNSTPAARKVMEIALKRNQSVKNIYTKLNELSPSLARLLESRGTMISTDPMERTMLLTIQMTGNFGYFSPSIARAEGKHSVPQFKPLTLERIKILLKLYSQGGMSFKGMFEQVVKNSNIDAEVLQKLRKIFQDEVDKTEFASEELLVTASEELIEFFFPKAIFSNTEEVKATQRVQGARFGKVSEFNVTPQEENIQ